MPQNLELKARCSDLAAARARVLTLPPRAHWVENQTDTYFHVPAGRLKLREINQERAELIFYQRPDHIAARTSTYEIVPVTDPNALKSVLTAALGLRGLVRKRRDIFLWHNVRIHLDQVDGLGSFIEFEAVLAAGEETDVSAQRLRQLSELLAITPAERLETSYGEMA